MARIRIAVDSLEFDEDGQEVLVQRKGQTVMALKLPMRIRVVEDEAALVSKMEMVVLFERLGTIPPTFRLGIDAKRKTQVRT